MDEELLLNENIKLEYQESGQLFRTYTTFLVSIMQHFIAGNALLFLAITYLTKNGTTLTQIIICSFALLGCVFSFFIQIRTYKYWSFLLNRCQELETILKINLYTSFYVVSQKNKILRSANMVKILYILFTIFWVLLLIKICGLNKITVSL